MRRLWGRRRTEKEDAAPATASPARPDELVDTLNSTASPSAPPPATVKDQRTARQVAFVSPDGEKTREQVELGHPHATPQASMLRSASAPVANRPNEAAPSAAKRPRVSEPIATTSTAGNGAMRAASASQPFPSFQQATHRAATSEGAMPLLRSISPFSTTSSMAPTIWRQGIVRPESRADSFGQIQAPVTWSEMCESDLVSNLGGRERTRQEVLWEIVGSEERYVQELMSLKECYIDPLLHPLRSPTATTPSTPTSLGHSQTFSADESMASNISLDHLPIAARFASTLHRMPSVTSSTHEGELPVIHGQSPDSFHRPLSHHHTAEPSADSTSPLLGPGKAAKEPSRPLRPRSSNILPTSPSTSSLPATFRHHLKSLGPTPHKKLHKPRSAAPSGIFAPPTLPSSLRTVLEVIGEGMLGRHETLSTRLRERYAEQYPLVRTLADVWAEQRWIVEHYATYVLHLEKALEEIEEALSLAPHIKTKGTPEQKRLAKAIMRLEEKATLRGESGLAICLSKPFQRLLKYPLLFQNLLYHTDPSTADYAAAQAMALEIDRIVRSIEDEKISEEEREKTRDAWARIDGINDKALMLPKSDRLLVEEAPLYEVATRRAVSDVAHKATAGTSTTSPRTVKTQKSTRRLSDILSASTSKDKEVKLGSKRDLWLVQFSDVVLRCQRTGMTQVPRTTTATKAKRATAAKQRNLYKFDRVERWEIKPPALGETGLVAMDAIHRKRVDLSDGDVTETEEEDEPVSPPEDAQSRMSFTYDGDEPKPMILPRALTTSKPPPTRLNVSHASPSTQAVVGRGGPANAKFSARLRPSYTTSPISDTRATSPTSPASTSGGRRFNAPTAASRARQSRPTSPMPPNAQSAGAATARSRAVSSPSPPPSPPRLGMPHSKSNASDLESGYARFESFWAADR